MPVQMIELEEVTMVEVSDEDLEAKAGGFFAFVDTPTGTSCC